MSFEAGLKVSTPFFSQVPFILLLLFPLSDSHHVVFEDVGQVAISTTYLHAVVPLKISGVKLLLDEFERTLSDVKDL